MPIVTYGMIALNVIFFFIEMSGGEPFIIRWSVVPRELVNNPGEEFITIFTSMFMHAGWAHLIGNMLYLWIFGDNIEDHIGHVKFLVFYLICGIAATFAQVAVNSASGIPNLGASGAISGVLGAYLVMFPNGRVNVLMGRGIVQLPALVVLGLWIALQLFLGFGSLSSPTEGGGVAYMAHIGGFVTGLVLAFLFGRSRVQARA